MKIFYISYWGVSDGLSVATVFPALKILAELEELTQIDYFTVERSDTTIFKDSLPEIPKVNHHPVYSKNYKLHLLTKLMDWFRIRNTLLQQAKEVQPDLVICRGAMAGAFGTFLHKKLKLRFVVESFEPHADYMAESAVWKKGGIKYNFQRKKEQEIKKYAHKIITVSYAYAKKLIQEEQLPENKVLTIPCVVDTTKFAFDKEARRRIRTKLSIPPELPVGVYLGKFGGIYYDDEAFKFFKQCYDFFQGHFYLLLLTPTSSEVIEQKLLSVGFPLEHVFTDIVAHQEVPGYLSAADFAFNLHAEGPTRMALSPIKNGEYWANGLPILIARGIGDDSEIIRLESGGAIVDFSDATVTQKALEKIQKQLKEINYREQVAKLAEKHRSFELLTLRYTQLIQGVLE